MRIQVHDNTNSLKVAIVHDWLTVFAGAERVLEQMINCFPQADIFSLVDFVPEEHRGFLKNKTVTTSFIQKLPFAEKHYRNYLPIMPLAIEQFDLSQYDLVLSSSHAVAKGVLTGPDQLHICMCYTPIRYAWDFQHQYLQESGLDKGIKGFVARYLLHRIRMWDHRTSNGVDNFIAISKYISRRIKKVYSCDSTVIYPPVDTHFFQYEENKEDYYITVSRLVPYKRVDLIVEAFTKMPDKQLVVIGEGPSSASISAIATSNIQLQGFKNQETLAYLLKNAKAFIFAAEEDFGIAPLEAQSCGTPVIAYGRGGVTETIIGECSEKCTGVFFDKQEASSICDAIKKFESMSTPIKPSVCRENALRFSQERFRREFKSFIQSKLNITAEQQQLAPNKLYGVNS